MAALINQKNKSNIISAMEIMALIVVLASTEFVFGSEAVQLRRWTYMFILLGVIYIPIAEVLFQAFDDSGYFFGKVFGIAISCIISYWMSYFKILKFGRVECVGIMLAVSAVCWLAFIVKKRKPLIMLDGEKRCKIIGQEVAFAILLVLFMYLKSFAPDAYGSEKFMNFGFMKSMMLTEYFPMEDMWFSGTNLNYYFFGQYIATFLTKVSNQQPEYTYNLMLMTICALSSVEIFSLSRHFLLKEFGHGKKIIYFGSILSVLCVNFMGNFHYIIFRWIIPFAKKMFNINVDAMGEYNYRSSTRLIGHFPETFDKGIHEFPAYEVIFGDLHAHVINEIFVVAMLGILASFICDEDLKKMKMSKRIFNAKTFAMALLIGMFMGSNYWDYPIYFVVTACVLLAFNFINHGMNLKSCAEALIHTIVILIISKMILLPFNLEFEKIASKPKLAFNHSAPWQLLVLWGIPFMIAIAGVVFTLRKYECSREIIKRKKSMIGKAIDWLKVFSSHVTCNEIYMCILACCGMGLVVLPEIIYMEDIYVIDSARANTMFKCTYQAFIMLGICNSYYVTKAFLSSRKKIKACGFVLTMLFLFMTGYFINGCKTKFGNVFDFSRERRIIANGYLSTGEFVSDLPIIEYINENVDGRPVVLECDGDSYTKANRVSVNTGKPTILGWHVHEWLWKNSLVKVNARSETVREIYTTNSKTKLKMLLDEFKVEYIVVGTDEYEKYGEELALDTLKSLATIEIQAENIRDKNNPILLLKYKK